MSIQKRGGRHPPKTRVVMSLDWSLRATLRPIMLGAREGTEVILWTQYDPATGKWTRLRRWVLPEATMAMAVAAVERVIGEDNQEAP